MLYNTRGVPWHKKLEILKLIAQEKHSMLQTKSTVEHDFRKILKGLTKGELSDVLKDAAMGKEL